LRNDDSIGLNVPNCLDPRQPASAIHVERLQSDGKDNFVKVALPLLVAALAAAAQAVSAQTASTAPASTQGPAPAPRTTSPFFGGVPSGTPTSEPITLTVINAIVRALDHNLGVLTAEEAIGRARGARWNALSELLPNVRGHIDERRQKINLAAFGFGSGGTESPFPNVPEIVGPFNVFDARLFVTQSVFDLEAINDARSEGHALQAAMLTRQSARELVINVAGTVFVQALAASARADAARAQLETATALYNQATSLRQSGIIAGVEVLRAQVQQSTQQQRTTAAANDFEKQKLILARLIGLPLGQTFTLDPNLPELPTPVTTVEDAVNQAYNSRADLQAALARLKSAEASRAAIVGSNLPSVHVSADVGGIGLTPAEAKTTYTLAGTVSVPIFNGNKTHGRLLQADAELRLRHDELEDLKASIYYEVRTAFLDLEATAQQLRVATTGRDLASQQLTQTRDRFAAGVASNVEVIQAQEAVALASEQFIAAQYGYNLAKGALVRGIGSSESILRQLIGGAR
jgi:outer membrane protein TolC